MNGLRSADTIEYRMTTIKAHFADRPLADVRTADVEDFLAGLREPSVLGPHQKSERIRTPTTINRYRSQLVQMFNFAGQRDYLELTPFNKPGHRQTLIKADPREKDIKRTRRLSEDEEQRLLTAAAPHLKLLITAALYTGMRRGEMLALTWEDLVERPGWIRLRGATTKSGKTRWVPVLPQVQAVFDFLRSDANGDPKPIDGAVFSNEVGERSATSRLHGKRQPILNRQRINPRRLEFHSPCTLNLPPSRTRQPLPRFARKFGVDDGVRTRDFRSHSPALYR